MFPNKGGKVELNYTSKIGNRTLAITKCPLNPEKQCYEWTINNSRKRKDGTERITYLCAECLRLRQKKEVAKDTPLPSLIAIRDTNKEIHWEGTGNGVDHCCEGPKDRAEVTIIINLAININFYRYQEKQ
jgi:hypothetical protein